MNREDTRNAENRPEGKGRDPLCPECGYAFDRYVDRLLEKRAGDEEFIECPVCGCGKCPVGGD